MLCSSCGALLPDNATACGQCGAPQRPRCPTPPPGQASPSGSGGADAATVFEPLSPRQEPAPRREAPPAPVFAPRPAAPQAGAGVHGWLVVTSGPDLGRDHRIDAPSFRAILGSAEGPDVLTVRGPGVERLHACLVLDAEGLRLRDLDTPAGTLIADRRIERAAVVDGDTITLGATTLLFRAL